MIKLTFIKDDSDNCRLYCTVEGELHACTPQGEPEYPVNANNFEIIK